MKLKQFALDYLSYNRAEQRGLVILMAALLGLIIATRLIPAEGEVALPDLSGYQREIEQFRKSLEAARKEDEEQARQRKTGRFESRIFPVHGDSGFRQKPRASQLFTIELNSTDTMELQRLRGIGPGFARRIIRYRDRLGGYLNREQLMEIDGMEMERYMAIKDYLTVNTDSVRKIALNQASFKEVLRHPYFPYELSKEIFLYRKKVKAFRNIEDLRQVPGISDSIFNRIRGYVEVR